MGMGDHSKSCIFSRFIGNKGLDPWTGHAGRGLQHIDHAIDLSTVGVHFGSPSYPSLPGHLPERQGGGTTLYQPPSRSKGHEGVEGRLILATPSRVTYILNKLLCLSPSQAARFVPRTISSDGKLGDQCRVPWLWTTPYQPPDSKNKTMLTNHS